MWMIVNNTLRSLDLWICSKMSIWNEWQIEKVSAHACTDLCGYKSAEIEWSQEVSTVYSLFWNISTQFLVFTPANWFRLIRLEIYASNSRIVLNLRDFKNWFCFWIRFRNGKSNWIFSRQKGKMIEIRKPHPKWVRFDVTTKHNWIFAGAQSTSTDNNWQHRKHHLKRDIRVSVLFRLLCHSMVFCVHIQQRCVPKKYTTVLTYVSRCVNGWMDWWRTLVTHGARMNVLWLVRVHRKFRLFFFYNECICMSIVITRRHCDGQSTIFSFRF